MTKAAASARIAIRLHCAAGHEGPPSNHGSLSQRDAAGQVTRARADPLHERRAVFVVALLAMLLTPSLSAQPRFPPRRPQERQPSPTGSPIHLPTGPPSWDKATAIVDAMIAARGLDIAFLEVAHGEEVVYSRGFRRSHPRHGAQVASATKSVTATLLMTTVERDSVDLDGRIDRWLPWIPVDKAGLAVRASCCRNLGVPGIRDNRIDISPPGRRRALEVAARQIAALDLANPPARCRLRRRPGASSSAARLRKPLPGSAGKSCSRRAWRNRSACRRAAAAIPRPSSRARDGHPEPRPSGRPLHRRRRSSLGFLLAMIDAKGIAAGGRILTEASVAAMERTRIHQLPKRFVPPRAAAPHLEYGLGLWCETIASRRPLRPGVEPGSWGAYPWIDGDRGIRHCLVVKDRLPNVVPYVDAARSTIDAMVDGN